MAREFGAPLAIALAALLPGCSLILDFSDSAAPHDAPSDVPYTAAECSYDEPNDSFATAAMIAPGTDTGPAAICPGTTPDEDWYKFAVPSTATTVTVAIQFKNALGDLDLELYDMTGALVARSFGFNDGETIACPGSSPPCTALTAGTYAFRVYPATPGQVNGYMFSVAIQ